MFPKTSLKVLFPSLDFSEIVIPDMSISGNFFEDDPQHEDLVKASKRLEQFQSKNSKALLANGYLETRSFYNTPNFERSFKGVKEFRNIHLGTDFWVPARTPIHTPFAGRIVISHDNEIYKDYGPLIIIEHTYKSSIFYTLYGHLSKDSLPISKKHKQLQKGDLIGYIGEKSENGYWVPHLHFQVLTDLLGETENYPGVAYPSEIEIWKERCPNPSLLFEEDF